MTIELAKQQAEKVSRFMVNEERVEHRTYTHTILVENNNQPQTKNQLKMAGQAAMKLPSTRKQALYQHNHLAPFKQPCGCKTRGADVGGMYYHITFLGHSSLGDVLQFTLEWAIAHLARPQPGEWKVLFAGNAFDLYSSEEVLKLSTVPVAVGADITTVAGATNEIVTPKLQQG